MFCTKSFRWFEDDGHHFRHRRIQHREMGLVLRKGQEDGGYTQDGRNRSISDGEFAIHLAVASQVTNPALRILLFTLLLITFNLKGLRYFDTHDASFEH